MSDMIRLRCIARFPGPYNPGERFALDRRGAAALLKQHPSAVVLVTSGDPPDADFTLLQGLDAKASEALHGAGFFTWESLAYPDTPERQMAMSGLRHTVSREHLAIVREFQERVNDKGLEAELKSLHGKTPATEGLAEIEALDGVGKGAIAKLEAAGLVNKGLILKAGEQGLKGADVPGRAISAILAWADAG